ncbi:MAG: universal stress protein [Chitinophagaceae bacterium]|nr:universal stress protein [Chitinophagaceae bacterium]MBL0055437.1 universal stress protein [Chitinophagaceae bacterium]
MNTIIVPVDFSQVAEHAAKYAAQLLQGHFDVNMILYHSYSKPGEADAAKEYLEALKAEILKEHIVKIETLAHEEDDFVDGLERAVRHRSANLVIMGITGKSSLAQVLFGSNTLKMAETKACPVLIVPENTPFTPIKHVMLTSDFKNTLNTTPSVPIKDFLDLFNPHLHIVNVDKDHFISLTEEYEKEKKDLKEMFADYSPEFYFMRLYDVDEAINLFAESRGIDLIIAIRKNQSFIEKIFSTSRAQKLTYQSKVPIMLIHE